MPRVNPQALGQSGLNGSNGGRSRLLEPGNGRSIFIGEWVACFPHTGASPFQRDHCIPIIGFHHGRAANRAVMHLDTRRPPPYRQVQGGGPEGTNERDFRRVECPDGHELVPFRSGSLSMRRMQKRRPVHIKTVDRPSQRGHACDCEVCTWCALQGVL